MDGYPGVGGGPVLGIPQFDKPDRQILVLGIDGTLSVLNDVDEYVIERPCKITSVQIALRSTGTTSGSTTVDVKRQPKQGGAFATILSAALSVAFNAGGGSKWAASWGSTPTDGKGIAGAAGEPNGLQCYPGDVLRVDVTAIPGVASAGLSVYVGIVNSQV
jgi:hypothetical protein